MHGPVTTTRPRARGKSTRRARAWHASLGGPDQKIGVNVGDAGARSRALDESGDFAVGAELVTLVDAERCTVGDARETGGVPASALDLHDDHRVVVLSAGIHRRAVERYGPATLGLCLIRNRCVIARGAFANAL